MKNLSLTPLAAISCPLALVAAFALAALAGPAAGAEDEGFGTRSESHNSGGCQEVDNPPAREACLAARAQYLQGNYFVSLSLMRKALALSPKDGFIRVMVGAIHLRRGALPQAEQEMRQARKDGTPDHAVLPVLFNVMIARHEEANLLSEFAEPAPGAMDEVACDILRGRAMAFQSMGHLAEAAAAADRALSLKRDSGGLIVRAEIATKLNDTALAGKLVDEAFRMNPRDVAVMLAKLRQLEQANDTAGVVAVSDQMLKLYPISTEARTSRIRVFLKQNQDARARAEVDAIMARRPKSQLGLFYKAVLTARAHDRKGAAQTIQGLSPAFVEAHPELALEVAQIVIDNGNVDSGAAILGRALGAAPDRLDVRLRLVALRMGQNSLQSALILLTPVKDSPDPRVQKLLAEVRARLAKDHAF